MYDYKLGDWVQALCIILDEQEDGRQLNCAEPNAIGHVVETSTDGWATVFFERTGRATLVGPDEIKFLGSADTGRPSFVPAPNLEES